MNALDRLLMEFWHKNDGKLATVIYIGHNRLNEIMVADNYFRMNIVHKTYSGIPYYRVSSDENHLAVY